MIYPVSNIAKHSEKHSQAYLHLVNDLPPIPDIFDLNIVGGRRQ